MNNFDDECEDDIESCFDYQETGSESDKYASRNSLTSSFSACSSKPVSSCHECNCCRVLESKIDELKKRLKNFERIFLMTPDVLRWFEDINRTISGSSSNKSNPIKHAFLTNNTEKLNSNSNSNETNSFEKNSAIVVPEIVIEDV